MKKTKKGRKVDRNKGRRGRRKEVEDEWRTFQLNPNFLAVRTPVKNIRQEHSLGTLFDNIR